MNIVGVNSATALARTLVSELAYSGVREVVLSPGSRSAPLAFALYDAAVDGRIRLHVRVDERSAAFLALGLARADQEPTVVVTTSGTAVANLHPAVLEAHHDRVPLVLLSADRPAALRGVGANQTIDQVHLFGPAVRAFQDVPAPAGRAGEVAFWRSSIARALASAAGVAGADPGPVHVNVAFDEPLTPDTSPADPADPADPANPERGEPPDPRGAAWSPVRATAGDPVAAADALGELLDAGAPSARQRTLVVVGADVRGAEAAAMETLATAHGWPVLAEPGAEVGGRVPCAPLVAAAACSGERPDLVPDRVLLVGRPTLHRSVRRLLSGVLAPVDVVALGPGWPDPERAARTIVPLDLPRAGHTRRRESRENRENDGWLHAWHDAGERVRATVADVLGGPEGASTALAAAAAVIERVPAASLLHLASSSVIRDVDLTGVRLPETVLSNRGVSGIDGTVSSAVGEALAAQRSSGALTDSRAVALVGDLAFLHDSGGLLIGPAEPRPDLTVVVLNDDGGGIFALLEQGAAEHAAAFERIFGTPHGTDLQALCHAHGIGYTQVTDPAHVNLTTAEPGIHVVEIPVSRASHRDLHALIRRRAAEVLAQSQR
ncbi:MAG TPA: 2-succinyl-5-enolpyruvyl-6-hydroxy-3-cyclohexene-1-carboxylic-acid synthase [Jiangellaceae bacterium]|nr:2-succinyl-5-enolpyruvyl-6-hydroxy-3-cyclohexene-1-carboxylic-acid synthase [Jiangellaceae bacterium]